jgi:enolase
VATFADGLEPSTEIHVATDGSSDGDGSEGSPFATIEQAAAGAAAGSSIVVHSGTYEGGTYLEGLAGTAEAPLWIGGQPGGDRPVLVLTRNELTRYWLDKFASYPLISLEDGYDQNDMIGHASLTEWVLQASRRGTAESNALQFPIQQTFGMNTIGDDLLVTNLRQLIAAVEGGHIQFAGKTLMFPKNTISGILIKINQVGSISETKAVIRWALAHGITVQISNRSGETEDSLIADIAKWATTLERHAHPVSGRLPRVEIKTGSFSRSDRTAKYNRLLRINEWERVRLNRPEFESAPMTDALSAARAGARELAALLGAQLDAASTGATPAVAATGAPAQVGNVSTGTRKFLGAWLEHTREETRSGV